MATLTIKNVPRELHKRLKKSAERHRRSMNSEVIALLEQDLMSRPVDPEKFLAEVRAARERTAAETGIYVTEKDLRKAKNWGRRRIPLMGGAKGSGGTNKITRLERQNRQRGR
ncbi:MAG: Arc family DNA-binding protein [Terriglobia bacterium]|jgi:plasmid stability protein